MRGSYVTAHRDGRLKERIRRAVGALSHCTLCPRRCGADRGVAADGFCRTGRHARVASYNAHFGEESVLVGTRGSGTIFFSYCNLGCVFCQNFDISHRGYGTETGKGQLARIMLALQEKGCANINFVTPSHVVAQILEALPIAVEQGLSLPLVYNSSGYDCIETLRLLDGIFDIYMPDLKFADGTVTARICGAPDYPEIAKAALLEMHRQVGDLALDADGIAMRGLLVRHLVMPNGLAGTRELMRFLAREVSPDTYVNVMSQYRPRGAASKDPELGRPVTGEAYQRALTAAREEGISRLDRPRGFFLA